MNSHKTGTKLFFRFVNRGQGYIFCIQLNDFVEVNQNKTYKYELN